MGFMTAREWEQKDPFIRMCLRRNVKLYPVVQMSMNAHIWLILEVTTKIVDDRNFQLQTYLFDNLNLCLKQIKRPEVDKHRLIVVIPRVLTKDNEYQIFTVSKILHYTTANNRYYAYEGMKGKVFIDPNPKGNDYKSGTHEIIYLNDQVLT